MTTEDLATGNANTAPATTAPATPAAAESSPAPEKTAEQVQQETVEAEQAFDKGFKTERGLEEPDDKGTDTGGDQPAAASAAAVATDDGKEKPLTAEEMRDLYKKIPGLEKTFQEEIRKVYGKFGEIQGNLSKMQQSGMARKLEAGMLKRLNGEFPEIAQMLAEDLSEFMAGTVATAVSGDGKPAKEGGATDDIDARVKTAVADANKATETKLLSLVHLSVVHPGWQGMANEPAFTQWLNTLPGEPTAVTLSNGSVVNLPADAAKYVTSDDSDVAAECFARYKAHKAATPPAKPRTKEQKDQRLSDAISPTGGTGAAQPSTIDDEAAFSLGFKTVRGGAS